MQSAKKEKQNNKNKQWWCFGRKVTRIQWTFWTDSANFLHVHAHLLESAHLIGQVLSSLLFILCCFEANKPVFKLFVCSNLLQETEINTSSSSTCWLHRSFSLNILSNAVVDVRVFSGEEEEEEWGQSSKTWVGVALFSSLSYQKLKGHYKVYITQQNAGIIIKHGAIKMRSSYLFKVDCWNLPIIQQL